MPIEPELEMRGKPGNFPRELLFQQKAVFRAKTEIRFVQKPDRLPM